MDNYQTQGSWRFRNYLIIVPIIIGMKIET